MILLHKKLQELEKSLSELRPDKNEKQIRNEANRVVTVATGLSITSIERYRSNPKAITVPSLEKLALYFNTTTSELLAEC